LVVIGLGISIVVCSAAYIARYFPNRALDNNNQLANAFHIKAVPEWDNLECHGRDKTRKFILPLDHCLSAVRTKEQPKVIYLLGDSHAAQLYWMVQRAISGTQFQLKFVNLEDDIPAALMENRASGSKTIEFVTKEARAGDILLMSIHRGQFNEQRDKHIPMSEKIAVNEKMGDFVKAVAPYFRRLNDAGVKIVLIKDTPLMQVVSTSPACALQIKMFGQSICRVSRQQDLHTRSREDAAYEKLATMFPNVALWDPVPSMYGEKDAIDVVDSDGKYIMQDWHHITQYQSLLLAVPFRSFIETFMVAPNK